MPKSILNIDRFEGGINSNSDPKDITDSEVANAVDAKFSKIGQITIPGLAENVQDIQSLGDSGVVSGYGLSTFQSTRSLSEAETGMSVFNRVKSLSISSFSSVGSPTFNLGFLNKFLPLVSLAIGS